MKHREALETMKNKTLVVTPTGWVGVVVDVDTDLLGPGLSLWGCELHADTKAFNKPKGVTATFRGRVPVVDLQVYTGQTEAWPRYWEQ